ncbi:hypothetical protein V6N13_102171 [Hibiscus sabdariffa]
MPMSRETVVPDSIQSQAVKTMELEIMWEGNTQVDLRVRDTASWMAEEAIGIIERDDEQRCTAMDLSAECEFSGARQQRKVRQLSEILMTDSSPVRVETSKLVSKRGRGRPKTKGTEATRIVNGSLSDSDFLHIKKVILQEAEETVQLGKLLGAAPKGNEKVVIQDIARIIEARELRQ